MLILQKGEKQDVVHISYTTTTQERAKCVVNHPLKNRRSIFQPKWHSCVLKHTKLALKRCIRMTAVHNRDLVNSVLEVNPGINFRARDGRLSVVQEGEGVIIGLVDVVQSFIIYIDAQFAG